MSQSSDKIFHVGRPNIGDRGRFLERLNEILDRRWLSNGGKNCHEFESELAKYLEVDHAITVCNATVGLEIAARAMGLAGEVIVPSFTFVATPHSLLWQQIKPVFADLDPATHNLDPDSVEDLIGPNTSGILAVHCWGRPAEIERLAAISDRRGLALYFDASHSLGVSHQGRMIGGFGKAEVFSLHATKFVNSFEGGVITTNDNQLAEKIRLMRNFGFTDYDKVEFIGTNGKMSEVSAAMGVINLESVEDFVEVNRRNHLAYQTGIDGLPGISLLRFNESERNNFQYVVLEVDPVVCPISRDDLLRRLHGKNIIARRYFYPGCHRMEPYASLYPQSNRWLTNTESLCDKVLVLPTGTAIGEDDVEVICSQISEIILQSSNCEE